ncbi:MAG: NAD(P)H-binding protein [Bacteroidia bacterium]|nr:NAD(P)H-binding protein [Bacteroidia bacterium]
MKNVIIAGASGMVGSHALEYCLEHPEVGTLTSLVRKASGKSHPKLKEIVHDNFLDYSSIIDAFKNQDLALFCIGVYTGDVGKEKFREITVDIPQAFAKALQSQNEHINFCLLSGAGADRTEKSRTMFARDKGAIENILDAMDLGEFHSFRPAYIYPVVPRDEPNLMYRVSRWLYKPLISKLGKNSSIKSTDLARAMVKLGLEGGGMKILENKDILDVLS